MTSKYRTNYEMDIDVIFEDEEKAKAVFLGEEWQSVFFDYADIADMAEHITHVFHISPKYTSVADGQAYTAKLLEGFGDFVRQADGSYKTTESTAKESGHITIKYQQEFEPIHTFEVSELEG